MRKKESRCLCKQQPTNNTSQLWAGIKLQGFLILLLKTIDNLKTWSGMFHKVSLMVLGGTRGWMGPNDSTTHVTPLKLIRWHYPDVNLLAALFWSFICSVHIWGECERGLGLVLLAHFALHRCECVSEHVWESRSTSDGALTDPATIFLFLMVFIRALVGTMVPATWEGTNSG